MTTLSEIRSASLEMVPMIIQDFDPGGERLVLIESVNWLCTYFHILAGASLLCDANPDLFHLNLCRAGENWRRLLVLLRRRSLLLPPASQNLPLLGVIAAGDWSIAAALARESATQRNVDDGEYTDEFLCAAIMQAIASSEGRMHSTLASDIKALGDTGRPMAALRMPVFEALVERDVRAFQGAFLVLASAREDEVEERANNPTTPVTAFVPYRDLWYEGFALLRIARASGLKVDLEPRGCPALGQVAMQVRYASDWVVPIDDA